uniref:ubiquitinyl hydrolase 1 n=1 Tax=Noctiluca scintillans TaxID=2966 RepID=A0A7S1F3S0_NOCSC
MGGASPYRGRFMGLPSGQLGRENDTLPLGDHGEKFSGLVNVQNTCYVNSVLQALYFCTPFRKAAIKYLHEEKEEDGSSDSLLTCLAELFAQIEVQKRSVGCITPRKFLGRLRKANEVFCTTEHQDAHEFLQFLLNDIVEGLKKKALKQHDKEKRKQEAAATLHHDQSQEEEPRTWVHDIFEGLLVNQMKCLCCENVTVRRETFLDLSVDIERHTSIAACLRAFESTELLRAGNKFFCDTCSCLQEAEKRLRIYQLPTVLTLHLKRFKYVERQGRVCRLPYRVVFPLQLEVVEHGRKNGKETPSSNGGSESGSDRPNRRFELRSVVVHIGRDSTRGHYVTVVRIGDRWVLLDDDAVRVVEPELLRSFYGTASGGSQSYGRENTHNNGHHNQSGWHGDREEPSDKFSHSQPLYERAPEGTCCGYLLVYEATEGHGTTESECMDLDAVADWISEAAEDRHLTESDSGESAEEHPTAQSPNTAFEDLEQTQAFEQRCRPRRETAGKPTDGAVPGTSAADAEGSARQARDRPERAEASGGENTNTYVESPFTAEHTLRLVLD